MTAGVDDGQPDQLLTVADITSIVGAYKQTICGRFKNRDLKASKFGTRIDYRIKRSVFETLLDRRTLTDAIAARLLRTTAITAES